MNDTSRQLVSHHAAAARPRVIVIGGGLAGIAAAVRLADHGLAVSLVETRKRLGGRATSFVDPATGQVLDNCQHVLLGCCTNLLDLYQRLGVDQHIQWHRKLYFTALQQHDGNTAPPVDTLEADDLPAPLHMTRSLMAFAILSLRQKLAISRGMLKLMRLGVDGRKALHGTSFAQWLADQGQPRGAVDKFWAPIIISALNERPDLAAADYAMQVFQEGFLSSVDAYVMGVSAVPLVKLYDTAEGVLERAGGRVLFSTSAQQLRFDGQRVTLLELADGQTLDADAYVSALPHDRLAKLCTSEMYKADTRLRRLDRLTSSPIIGIHLWFDTSDGRPVMDLPHLVTTESPLQWIFNKGEESGDRGQESGVSRQEAGSSWQWAGGSRQGAGGAGEGPTNGECCQHLHGVISAAHDLVDEPAERIIDMAVGEIHKALPATRSARLVHATVIKEKRATFSARPGVDALRPAAAGAIENLYLAGDWCRTGWPATMEGAVRSGYLAAAALLHDAGHDHAQSLVPDLSPEMLYRVIGG